jgi:hypothetical protein
LRRECLPDDNDDSDSWDPLRGGFAPAARKVWRKVGVRNGRPVLFSHLIYPSAAAAAAALDTAFPWDETAEGAGFWLTVYDKLTALAGSAPAMSVASGATHQ